MLSEMNASSLKQRKKTVTTSDISTMLDILTTSKLYRQKILFFLIYICCLVLNKRLTFISR